MTFGWEGFSFEHPDDWAPVALSGDRKQGYARVASSGRLILQIRWRDLRRPADAQSFLDTYLSRLKRDAEKAKTSFHAERDAEEGRTTYRYSGASYGKGALFQPDHDSRAFVLEVASTKNDSLGRPLREALASFRLSSDSDRWSAFGLDLCLPKGLRVERKEFLAGKTRLFLGGKGVKFRAERWGFSDQLLSKHGLEPWARAILDADKAELQNEPEGLRLRIPSKIAGPAVETIVQSQPQRNQIVLLQTASRDPKWRPRWDWLM